MTPEFPIEKEIKVYSAVITQTGTNAPVATVLQNTLGGTLVWARTGVGIYTGTLTGAFTEDKTAFYPRTGYAGNWDEDGKAGFVRTSTNVVTLTSCDNTNVEQDSIMNECTVEIRVYS